MSVRNTYSTQAKKCCRKPTLGGHMAAYDRLPKWLRQAVANAPIPVCPRSIKRGWDRWRKAGYTPETFLADPKVATLLSGGVRP